MIYFRTKANTNLRRTPRKTEPNEPTNIVAVLPTNHWFLGHQVSGDWIEGFTSISGINYAGFAHSSLLKAESIIPSRNTPSSKDSIKRHEIFFEDQAEKLRPFLSINPPQDRAKATEALSFNRSRVVELDWKYVFSPNLVHDYFPHEPPPSKTFRLTAQLSYFRRYFDELWGIDTKNYIEIRKNFLFKRNIKIPIVSRSEDGETSFAFEYKKDALVLSHPLAERLFYVETVNGGPDLTEDDFEDYASYLSVWEKKADSIEVCFEGEEAEAGATADKFLTAIDEVDLAPSIILRQYQEIQDLKPFATTLSTKADELANSQVTGLLSDNQINQLLNAILRMKQPQRDVTFSERRLVDRASDLNYILPLTQTKYTYPDRSVIQLEPGTLYQPYRTTVFWRSKVKRVKYITVTQRLLGVKIGSYSKKVEWMESVRNFRQVTKYGKIQVDLDPWEEKEVELAEREGLQSYRFERINGEYFDVNGASLESVIENCDRDEDFRRQTAIWIPIYEQKLTEGEVLTKYTIIKRPFRGYAPVRSPTMFIHESLSYRTAWRSSELGELVHSINMAPGEERTITVEQTTSRQIETVQSTTSILDLTRSDTLELSSEIEKEAGNSSESTRTSTFSASASGSIGAFGGSASGSTSSTKTAKQFSRQMEKVARKAARNLTRRSHQEVKSTTTVTTNASRSESTSINVKNINEGRTLNLLFYRLYNIFDASLTAESLQFVSEEGTELVMASGISVPRVVELADMDLALSPFDLDSLPYDTVAKPGSKEYARVFVSYWSYIIDQILNLLRDEYDVDGEENSARVMKISKILKEMIDQGAGSEKLPYFEVGEEDYSLDTLYRRLGAALRKIIEQIEKSIDDSADENEPLIPLLSHDLRVASPGLYVDTVMGVSPATEPYAEEMRAQKVMMEASEVSKQQAIADYYRTLSGQPPINRSHQNLPKILVGFAESDRKLVLKRQDFITEGIWKLEVDSVELSSFEVIENQKTIELQWDAPQDWVKDPEGHLIALRSELNFVLIDLRKVSP